MTIFSRPDFDQHRSVHFHEDPVTGLRAIIAVHNTNLGPALGGCRMWAYADDTEALDDVLRLSRGMTYKAALAGLDFGGGKSVIIGDANTQKTDALVAAMARFIDSLGGVYHTAEDVGMTVQDMDVMRRVTPYAHGVSDGTGNPSPATAWGVFVGIRAAVAHRYGADGVRGLKIAVQGLGNVGRVLCKYLAEAGAALTVADIDEDRVREMQETFGATATNTADIHRADVDVFAPCALGAGLNDVTIPDLRAGVVAGSANNQLAEARHGAVLHGRGILYAPDYVINAGGLIDIAAEGPGYDTEAVLYQVAGIEGTLARIFARADAEGAAPETIADVMAEERFLGGVPRAA